MDFGVVLTVIGGISTIVGITLTIINFANGRKDKAIQDVKENHQTLIEYRLDKVDEKLDKISGKLDRYESETDEKIDKAIQNHIAIYHNRNRKSE